MRLGACLQAFGAPEALQGDNAYVCEACEKAAKERHVAAALAALNYDRLFAPSGFNLECDLQKATEELSDACEEAAYTGQLDRAMQALSILYAVSAKPPKALFDKLLYACGGGCDELRGAPSAGMRLYGVIEHEGSFDGGHYISYVRLQGGSQWYRMSDSIVKEVAEEVVLSKQAFMLFYERE